MKGRRRAPAPTFVPTLWLKGWPFPSLPNCRVCISITDNRPTKLSTTMSANDSSSSSLAWIGWTIRKLCWTLSILSSIAAGTFVVTHFYAVRGGQQQVAVAALGLLIVLVPYTIARGVSELGR